MNFAQQMRMVWIDHTLIERGKINRQDIADAFFVSLPQASNDLKQFNKLFQHRMKYNPREKCYEVDCPIYCYSTELRSAVWQVTHGIRILRAFENMEGTK